MKGKLRIIRLGVILAGAGAGLYYGWRLFWFMTDDAFIAFRYVSNSILGLGYVWNPPPFQPVEGYTSFLWVVLLDVIWRWLGVEPPQVANYLSLFFSLLTLGLVVWIVMRMSLGERLARIRLLFLALVLLGTLSNRTFLAWTSSGLETALFNFCFTLWIAIAVMSRRRDGLWLFGLTLSASLVYLARPDGLLVLACTLVLSGLLFFSLRSGGRLTVRTLTGLSPLVIPVAHLAWRRFTYGEWLPNTYYAKHVAAWPESGIRYLASFILEYGLWFWIAILLWLGFVWFGRGMPIGESTGKLLVPGRFRSEQLPVLPIVLVTILGHVGYYTLIIGGDHFEYRVLSYLIPLVFISMVWMLNRIMSDAVMAACAIGLFILISWPLPWTHWTITRDLTTRDDTWIMRIPIAPDFPRGLRWYAEPFDKLQSWLIEHHVCMRHQEHKIFYEFLSARFPARSMHVPALAGEYPVAAFQSVGIPGWAFPRVAILDAWGLNDYVIARHRARPRKMRYMAHDRIPPEGYLESYSLNYGLMVNQSSGFIRRDYEVTAEDIKATEEFWIDRIVRGIDLPFSYSMLNRIGESLYRTSKPDSAVGYLSKAIALDSTCARAFMNLAKCYSKMDRDDLALAYLQKAVRLEPDIPLVRTRLGRAYTALGYDLVPTEPSSAMAHFAEAEQHLTEALRRDSTQVEALVELASINLFLDRVDSSEVFLSKLESCNMLPPGELHLLGDRYIFKQRLDLAIRAYRLAIQHHLNVMVTRELRNKYPELH